MQGAHGARQPGEGVLDGLRALLRPGEACASLAHGTTTVTNAIVEGRVAPVGLVTTRGFRDVLEIARMNRAHLYRLELPARAEPLVPRRRRLEITERVGPDGTVQTPLAPGELAGLVAALRAEGVEAVAVCLLHAYANPRARAGAPARARAALPPRLGVERDQRGVPGVRAHLHHRAERQRDAAGRPLPGRAHRRARRRQRAGPRSACCTPRAA